MAHHAINGKLLFKEVARYSDETVSAGLRIFIIENSNPLIDFNFFFPLKMSIEKYSFI